MTGIKCRFLAAVTIMGLTLYGTQAFAGPIIIAGTDADDHGSVSGGVNQLGWKFMQSAFQNLGPQVGNSNKTVVCIGCNPGQAASAFNSAFSLSNLVGAGWSSATLTSAADITNFFAGAGVNNITNTGILYMPTVSGNVGGGITDAQLGIVNLNSVALNTYVVGGGGLFTQEQANSSVGYGWLSALLPGLTVSGDNAGGVFNSSQLQLTPAGIAAFPGLTSAELSGATPWHAYFGGSFGGLQVLATGNGNNVPVGALDDAVVLGGGANTVIVCGQPGLPACSADVPEPGSLSVSAWGLLGMLGLLRKRKKKSSS